MSSTRLAYNHQMNRRIQHAGPRPGGSWPHASLTLEPFPRTPPTTAPARSFSCSSGELVQPGKTIPATPLGDGVGVSWTGLARAGNKPLAGGGLWRCRRGRLRRCPSSPAQTRSISRSVHKSHSAVTGGLEGIECGGRGHLHLIVEQTRMPPGAWVTASESPLSSPDTPERAGGRDLLDHSSSSTAAARSSAETIMAFQLVYRVGSTKGAGRRAALEPGTWSEPLGAAARLLPRSRPVRSAI